jgi:hypothetical protein
MDVDSFGCGFELPDSAKPETAAAARVAGSLRGASCRPFVSCSCSRTPRVLSAILAAVGLLLLGAAGAEAGYGPIAPPGPPVPGGFKIVIASKTLGPRGGTLLARSGRTRFRLSIQHGSLSRRIQFTLTRPHLPAVRHVLPHALRLRLAFALLANLPSGEPIRRFSRKAATLVVLNRGVTTHAVALSWNARRHRFLRLNSARIAPGRATIRLRHFAEVVVASSR